MHLCQQLTTSEVGFPLHKCKMVKNAKLPFSAHPIYRSFLVIMSFNDKWPRKPLKIQRIQHEKLICFSSYLLQHHNFLPYQGISTLYEVSAHTVLFPRSIMILVYSGFENQGVWGQNADFLENALHFLQDMCSPQKSFQVWGYHPITWSNQVNCSWLQYYQDSGP